MARNRKKISLYEVISKTRPKSGNGKILTWLHSKKSAKDEPITAKPAPEIPERAIQWPRRPKIVQFNAGRVEISMPYQLAIALLLGVVLLVLVFFRLGQMSTTHSAIKTKKIEQKKPTKMVTADAPQTADVAEKVLLSMKKSEPSKPKGNNRIVIQTYQLRTQLEPVKQYFARFGIETEIKKLDNWYYLVTKDKYGNPQKPGTDGYLVKQKIIELGAKYKAPPGYETFGKKPFHDAYGMKFDD